MKNTAALLIHCPDQKGIVSAVTSFLSNHNANIVHAVQHQDTTFGLFLMRLEWDLSEFDLKVECFEESFKPIAERFEMQWYLAQSSLNHKVAIFVSKYDHCLADLLYRHQSGELNCDIPLIISNHPDTRYLADFHDIPFYHIPVNAENKVQAEREQLKLLEKYDIDLIVLARYMQILSPEFVARYHHKIINVHHSFLPAFPGGRPHQQAFERGVKIIGATSHYVTDALDEGPIIEQDVATISHRDQLEDLIQKGRDLEKLVLSKAMRWHINHRILVYANKSVVFI
ncbi:MAG: formyltetrahydrofolate deformylase [Balneolales bacterium]